MSQHNKHRQYKYINVLAGTVYNMAFEKGFYRESPPLIEKHLKDVGKTLSDIEKTLKDRKFYNLYNNLDSYNLLNHWTISDDGYKVMYEATAKDTFESNVSKAILQLLCICRLLNIDMNKHVQLSLKYLEKTGEL